MSDRRGLEEDSERPLSGTAATARSSEGAPDSSAVRDRPADLDQPTALWSRPSPLPPPLPPGAKRGGDRPAFPEASRGVVSGVGATSSRPPPKRSDLPTLAPPKRRGQPSERPPGAVDADEIDIDLEALVEDPASLQDAAVLEEADDSAKAKQGSAEGKSRRRRQAHTELPAICMYGRYEVLGRIAFGGMAEIFLGRESTSVGASRYLVIKRILPHVADDDQFVEMFLDEARLAIQLNHPNICHIYEFGELEDSYFIAMEWVNGVPLGKLIRKARLIGGVPPEIGVRLIAQVAEALHYAHRARDALGRPMDIVHRDVSPHNVMVAYDGQVKLLDFGIAKAATHASKTEAGVVKGKFSYMAPEQCLGKPIDARADVFALGICLYETLTGKALYHRENEYETMRAVIHDPPPAITEVNKALPEALDEIVQKALKKEPADRFQSAGELQTALEEWLANARKVVNAATVAELMEELYEDQIARGPLVDSTPFGQSFQRMKVSRPAGKEQSGRHAMSDQTTDRSAVSASDAAAVAAPARRSPWALAAVAVVLLVVGVGSGYLLFYRPRADDTPRVTATAAASGAESPRADQSERALDEALAVAPDPTELAEVETQPPEPVEPEPGGGGVEITSTPSGAMVRVDGERVEGTTPLTLDELEPGTHHVVIERAGYRSFEADVEIVAGEQASLSGRLAPEAREPAAPPGRLSINTRPWSKVYVGRRLLGTTPIADARVTSGRVRLRLVDRDGQSHTKSVQVPPNGVEQVFFDLSAP